MAKKTASDGPSKTQIIKDYYKANPEASPKDAVAGVKKDKGIDVSLALTSKIKYTAGGKPKKAKKTKVKATKATTATAGGSKHGEKAQAIRDTLGRLGKKAKPNAVIADLKGQGIVASYSQVHTIRKTLFKRGRKPGSKVSVSAAAIETIAMEHLLEAKKLAEKLGGIEAARHALSALSKLQ